jgi:hypothetical protein
MVGVLDRILMIYLKQWTNILIRPLTICETHNMTMLFQCGTSNLKHVEIWLEKDPLVESFRSMVKTGMC